MLITHLRLQNFRQHADTRLELGPGLTGITGANGAGKSTILEAIGFALYGVGAARGGKDTVKRRGAAPRAPVEVELSFELGSRRFRVVRGLNAAELFQEGADQPLANSLAAVTQRAERLLGMTRDEFFKTYFTGQKELALMAGLGAADRGRFLSNVLGYERLKDAQDRNRDERKLADARLQALRSGMPSAADLAAERTAVEARLKAAVEAESAAARRAETAAAELAAAVPDAEAEAARRDEHRRLEAEYRIAQNAATTAMERVSRAQQAVAEAEQAAARLAELDARLQPLAALREEDQRLARAAEGVRDRETLARAHADETASVARLEAELAALPTAAQMQELIALGQKLRMQLEEAEKAAVAQRRDWTRDEQEARTRLQALRDQYTELKEQHERLTAAGDDGLCPTCRRPLKGHREEVLTLLADQLEEVRLNGQYLARRAEQLKDEPAELKELEARRATLQHELEEARSLHARRSTEAKRADELRASLDSARARLAEFTARLVEAPPAYDAARHAEVRRQRGMLEETAKLRERTAADAARLDAARTEQAAALAALEAARLRGTELLAALRTLAFDPATAEQAEARRAAAQAEERAAALASADAQAERRAAEEARTRIAARIAELEARSREAAEAETELRLRQELDRAFTELRTDLNAALRPELAELASGFLRDLTQGRYQDLELDEQYQAAVVDDGEVKPVISGGEEDLVNLALRLAVSQMIADRAGQPLSLLVLDEIFGSLDEPRRGAVIELLRSLADRFPQVILITHVDSLRDGFDRIVRVTYDATTRTSIVADETPEAPDVAA
jgi:exonuclease SbcC